MACIPQTWKNHGLRLTPIETDLEQMSSGDCLEVCLDRGEPEAMVLPGLRDAGHRVECIDQSPDAITIEVICGG